MARTLEEILANEKPKIVAQAQKKQLICCLISILQSLENNYA